MAINSFAENLKALIMFTPYSINRFSEQFDVPRKTVVRWTMGWEEPDIDTLIGIADFFRLSVDSLVRDEYHPPERELKNPELLSKVIGGKKGSQSEDAVCGFFPAEF